MQLFLHGVGANCFAYKWGLIGLSVDKTFNQAKDHDYPELTEVLDLHDAIPKTDSFISPEPQSVVIAILTFQRSARLRRLLPHVVNTLKSVHDIEILIIDNNPLPNELRFAEEFAEQTHYPIHYVHEPKPGVSNARNAAIKFASTRFLAFLDDDMEVTENWIDGLVKVAIEHKAGVVFGPLIAKFEDPANPENGYLAPFYTRQTRQTEEGLSDDAFGTGGCLIDLERCLMPEPPFDPRLNESGGEDDIFFEFLHENGIKYGWAPSAICYECVPKDRTTPDYIAKRHFGFGQGPTRIAASRGVSGSLQIFRHMSVGFLQFCFFGTIYLLSKLMNRPASIRYLALSARGLGKILWFDRFSLKYYGGPPS